MGKKLKKFFIKILIIINVTCFILYFGADFALALSDDNDVSFNLRITREEFSEISDTLIMQDENKKNDINLDEVYFNQFNMLTGNFNHDQIFSARSDEFKYGFSANQKEEINIVNKTSQDFQKVYNIDLSGTQSKKVNKSSKNKSSGKIALLSEVNSGNKFSDKFKEIVSLINSGENVSVVKKNLIELEKTVENDAINLSNIAKLYARIGERDKAGELLQRAESLSPNDFKILYMNAVHFYNQDKLFKAEERLKKVAALNPDFMHAHYNLGNIYYKEQKYREAINSFRKAMDLAPENPDIYYNIGLTLERIDQPQMAKEFYAKCIDLNPGDKEALKALEKLEIGH